MIEQAATPKEEPTSTNSSASPDTAPDAAAQVHDEERQDALTAARSHHQDNPGLYGPMGNIAWERPNALVPEVTLTPVYDMKHKFIKRLPKSSEYGLDSARLSKIHSGVLRDYQALKDQVAAISLTRYEAKLAKGSIRDYLEAALKLFEDVQTYAQQNAKTSTTQAELARAAQLYINLIELEIQKLK